MSPTKEHLVYLWDWYLRRFKVTKDFRRPDEDALRKKDLSVYINILKRNARMLENNIII